VLSQSDADFLLIGMARFVVTGEENAEDKNVEGLCGEIYIKARSLKSFLNLNFGP
jgi:hypothetical protein